ncbi:hypothetical protein D3C85_1339280 [compost metagenome]
MKSKALIALALGAALASAGCVSMGTNFSQSAVDALQPGISTRADAERALGRPNSVSNLQDGTVLLQWVHTQAVLMSAESKHVALLFDANGKFLRVFHQTQTSM